MLSNFNIKALSNFNFGLATNNIQTKDIKDFLELRLNQFLNGLKIETNFIKELEFNNLFTDVDFLKKVPDDNNDSFVNKYLYPFVFNDLHHVETEPKYKMLQHTVKYAYTIDQSLAKKEIIVSNYKIQYGEMLYGRIPMLYFIYIAPQELIDLCKKL